MINHNCYLEENITASENDYSEAESLWEEKEMKLQEVNLFSTCFTFSKLGIFSKAEELPNNRTFASSHFKFHSHMWHGFVVNYLFIKIIASK